MILPKGLSKWSCHNFNLPYKVSECKERKGTRGLYMSALYLSFLCFLILFLVELGLSAALRLSLVASRGYSLVAVLGLLIVVASLVGF